MIGMAKGKHPRFLVVSGPRIASDVPYAREMVSTFGRRYAKGKRLRQKKVETALDIFKDRNSG
jgi:hypothetical protein